MRLHYLQHVPFETPAAILDWVSQHKFSITATHLYNPDDPLPEQSEFELLVVMGGPMGVYDTSNYPWLETEAAFIRQSIQADKPVLGICLGAQLIASALGAEIKKNQHREIGWFPLDTDPALQSTRFKHVFEDNMLAFHWHGDTFELPENAVRIASSQACKNQGFIINKKVVGLQFHLETNLDSAALLIENCGDELDDSRYVQSKKEMLKNPDNFIAIKDSLSRLLTVLTSQGL